MEMYFKIDYLNFTVKPLEKKPALQRAFDLLGVTPEPLQGCDKGLHGYKASYRCPGVMVFFSPNRPEVHVQITGEGCNFYKDRLFDLFNVEGVNFTRCDLACDVINGEITLEDFWGFLQRGHFVCKSRSVEFICSADKRGGTGKTVYIGSRKSELRLRVYDKGKESKTQSLENVWLRYEFQTRGDCAKWVVSKLIEKRSCQDVFYGMIDFVRPVLPSGNDKDMRRWSTWGLWDHQWRYRVAYCGYQKPSRTPSLSSSFQYVKNAGAIMKVLRSTMPDFYDILETIIDDAELKEKHSVLAYSIREALSPSYGATV